jgi:hypothetical protein
MPQAKRGSSVGNELREVSMEIMGKRAVAGRNLFKNKKMKLR